MKRYLLIIAVVVGIFEVAISTVRAVTIDGFIDGYFTPLTVINNPDPTPDVTFLQTEVFAAVLGDYRYISIQWINGGQEEYATTKILTSGEPEYLDYQAGSSVVATTRLIYDGQGTPGGGLSGFDLTQGGAQGIYIDFTERDQNMKVTVTAKSGSTTGTQTKTISDVGNWYFPFSGFSPSVNFGSLDLLQFDFNVDPGIQAADFTIDYIETRENPPGLPDPSSTIALLTVSLGFLGVARQKFA